MKDPSNYIKKFLSFILFSCLIFFSSSIELSAKEINWVEVSKSNNEIQFIDVNSLRYNNKGFLSVITKYIQFNPDNEEIISTSSYLMAVDCEKRLFSKYPVTGEVKQVKEWEEPTNDKLIKKTIINSCSY